MLEWITFIAGTAVLAYISRSSLREKKSHGFYRFLAWELMLVLVVQNIGDWPGSPFTPSLLVCRVLMCISLLLVILGYGSLRQFGQQDDNRNDVALLAFEKTTVLVTHGIYRYIRHPMYSSLIFLDGGLLSMQVTWFTAIIALIACIFLVITALTEEGEDIRYFGSPYEEYMKRSKRFVPFLL